MGRIVVEGFTSSPGIGWVAALDAGSAVEPGLYIFRVPHAAGGIARLAAPDSPRRISPHNDA